MSTLSPALAAALRARLRKRIAQPGSGPPRIGAELEWIVLAADGRPAPIIGAPGDPGTLEVVRALASRRGGCEKESALGAPLFALPGGGRIGWEPGGQLELATAPERTPSALLRSLRDVAQALSDTAAAIGLRVLSVGIDPENGVDRAPLRTRCARYDRMAAYFDTIGPAGARMMRQTAALQLSVDVAPADRALAWCAANAMAPLLAAIFASSPLYTGRATGHASFRAANWRQVDPARTGVLPGESLEGEYLDFALRAPALLLGDADAGYLSFAELASRGRATLRDWDAHLTTLFPEVRPRGHLELRSADSVAVEHLAAAIALVAGVFLHRPTLRAAADLLGPPDRALLAIAARDGLRSPAIAAMSRALADLALAGCRALGAPIFAEADVAGAEDFFDAFTRRSLSPGDARERLVSERPCSAPRSRSHRSGEAPPGGDCRAASSPRG